MRVLTLQSSCSIIKGMIDAKMLPVDLEYPVEVSSTPERLCVHVIPTNDTHYFPLREKSILV